MIPLGLLSAGAGLLQSGIQLFSGNKNIKQGQRALNEFERQELTNAFEKMPISTVGSDLMREESSRTTASLIDSARSGGARGVWSSLPRIQAMNNTQNQEGRAYLDNQVQQRNYAIAQDDVRIRGMQEDRDNQDLAGIGAQIQAGREDRASGLRGIGNSLISGFANFAGSTPQVDSVGSPVSQGVSGFGTNFSNPAISGSMPSKLNFSNYSF